MKKTKEAEKSKRRNYPFETMSETVECLEKSALGTRAMSKVNYPTSDGLTVLLSRRELMSFSRVCRILHHVVSWNISS